MILTPKILSLFLHTTKQKTHFKIPTIINFLNHHSKQKMDYNPTRFDLHAGPSDNIEDQTRFRGRCTDVFGQLDSMGNGLMMNRTPNGPAPRKRKQQEGEKRSVGDIILRKNWTKFVVFINKKFIITWKKL